MLDDYRKDMSLNVKKMLASLPAITARYLLYLLLRLILLFLTLNLFLILLQFWNTNTFILEVEKKESKPYILQFYYMGPIFIIIK